MRKVLMTTGLWAAFVALSCYAEKPFGDFKLSELVPQTQDVAQVQANLDAEASARELAVSNLQNQATGIVSNLQEEVSARVLGDAAVQSNLTELANNPTANGAENSIQINEAGKLKGVSNFVWNAEYNAFQLRSTNASIRMYKNGAISDSNLTYQVANEGPVAVARFKKDTVDSIILTGDGLASVKTLSLGGVSRTNWYDYAALDAYITTASNLFVGIVSNLQMHTSQTDNPHSVTAAQVGLGNVDDTADADKPVSSIQQSALDLKTDEANYDLLQDDTRFDLFPRSLIYRYQRQVDSKGYTETSRQFFRDMTGLIGGGSGSTVNVQNVVILNDIPIIATNVWEQAVRISLWGGSTWNTFGYYSATNGSNFWMKSGIAWTIPSFASPATNDVLPSYVYPPQITLTNYLSGAQLIYASMAAPTFTWTAPSGGWVTNKGSVFPDLASVTNSTRVLIRNGNALFYYLSDLTANSVWNSRHKNRYNVTLITEKHAIGARHVTLSVGDTVSFVGLDNSVWSTTVSAVTNIGSTITDDVVIYRLATNHPSYISHIGIAIQNNPLCSTRYTGLPQVYTSLPAFYIDQMKTFQGAYTSPMFLDVRAGDGLFGTLSSTDVNAVDGDSGSPYFVISKNDSDFQEHLWLSFCFWYPTYGDYAVNKYSAITNAIAGLGDTNIVARFDAEPYRSAGARINNKVLYDRFRIPTNSVPPASPSIGDTYIDTTATNTLKVWNGTAWKAAW